MTLQQLFESEYYFAIGIALAVLYLVVHIYTNKDDGDMILDFICVCFCILLIIGWPLIVSIACIAIPIFGTIFLLGWILNKIRTR